MSDGVVCKVCGRKLKQMTGSHLKRHKMTFPEYLKAYPPSTYGKEAPITPAMVMAGLTDWAQKGVLPDNVKGAVDQLYTDSTTKLRVIMMAVALNSVTRLANLQDVVDKISGKLFDPKTIEKEQDVYKLINMYKLATQEVGNITQLFKEISLEPSRPGGGSGPNQFFGDTAIIMGDTSLPVPPDARARNELFTTISSFVKAVLSPNNGSKKQLKDGDGSDQVEKKESKT